MSALRYSLVTILLALVFCGTSIAEQFEFRVMASKGKPVIKKENTKKWKKITTGLKIFKNDKIKITSKQYLSLVHSSGKTIELKKAGTYTASELSKQVAQRKSNVSKRFANYLLDEISESDGLLGSNDYRKNMELTGSVERSMNTQPFMGKNKLKLNSPKKCNYINNNFTFKWHPTENVKEYTFILSDRFDKPILSKNVTGNSITINANESKLERDTYYFWKVKVKNDDKTKSDDACFLVLSDEKASLIQDTVRLIQEEVGSENSAAALIILAAFYEQNFIVDKALKAYKDAIALAPEVNLYKNLYFRFIRKLNIEGAKN